MQGLWWHLEIKWVAARTETRLAIISRNELIFCGERRREGLVGVVDALVPRAGGGWVKVVFLEEV